MDIKLLNQNKGDLLKLMKLIHTWFEQNKILHDGEGLSIRLTPTTSSELTIDVGVEGEVCIPPGEGVFWAQKVWPPKEAGPLMPIRMR